jgi:quinol monooxygenase YgiN
MRRNSTANEAQLNGERGATQRGGGVVGRVGWVLVVNRFRVAEEDAEAFRLELMAAHEALAQRPGYVDGTVGRNVDDPSLWILHTRWENVGSYRRALSSYDVKLNAVPLLSRAVDEPSAYEIVTAGADTELNQPLPRSLG